MADGLWQKVRLILDRESAEEVKRESQDALKEGTDPKHAERNLQKVEGRFDRVKKAAVALGAAIVAAFTVRVMGRFLRESFQAAEQLRSSRIRVQQALRNEGIQWEAVEGQVKSYTRALWESHRLTEGEVNPSLQALLVITGDYELSLRGVGIAADLAAAANMDVQSAARLVGRVMNGETTALRRYGITIEEGADAVQVLEDRLAGMAKAAAPPTVVLTKAWGDLKEAIGEVLIVGGDTDSILGGITDRIRGLTDDINANQEQIGRWVGGVAHGFGVVGRAALWVLNGIRMAAESIGALLGALSVQIPIWARTALAGVERAVLETVEFLAGPLRVLGISVGQEFMEGSIEGVKSRQAALKRELEASQAAARDAFADIGSGIFRGGSAPDRPDAPSFTPTGGTGTGTGEGDTSATDEQRDAVDKLVQSLEDERDALQFSRWELIERSEAYRNATPEQQRMVRDTYDEIEALNARADAEARDLEAREVARQEAEQQAQAVQDRIGGLEGERDALTLTSMELLRQSDAYRWATDAQRDYMEGLLRTNEALREQQRELDQQARQADRAGRQITQSFEQLFTAFRTGFGESASLMDGFQEAAKGVGAAVVGALAEGQADYHMAQGAGKLAEGTWPPNPAAIASSLKHFFAAGLFRALPGLVSGGGGSGGGAGALASSRGADRSRSARPDPTGPDIIIRVDGVNPQSPTHQQLIGETSRKYQQRYGGRIRVEGN